MVLKACDIQHCYPQAVHVKEVKTAIYCCLHHCSSLLLQSASLPPHLHMIRGWLTKRQTCSAVSWPHTSSSHSAAPSEVYLAWWRTGGETVWRLSPPLCPAPCARPPYLPLNLPVTTQLSLFSGFSCLSNADPKMYKQCLTFGLVFNFNVTFVFWCIRCISHICKYLLVCFTQTESCSLHCSSCQWMYPVRTKIKKVNSFEARLFLSLCQVF